MLIWSVALLGLGVTLTSQGALFSGTYTFSTGNNDVPAASSAITFGAFTTTGVTADTWSSATQQYGASGWGTTFGNYVSFILTPSPAVSGYSLTTLGFDVTAITKMLAGAGNGEWEIWNSGGTSAAASGTFALPDNGTTSHVDASVNFAFDNAITIRFYGLASNAGKDSDMAFDNVLVGGVSPVPEPVDVALGIFAGTFAVGGLVRHQRVRRLFSRGIGLLRVPAR